MAASSGKETKTVDTATDGGGAASQQAKDALVQVATALKRRQDGTNVQDGQKSRSRFPSFDSIFQTNASDDIDERTCVICLASIEAYQEVHTVPACGKSMHTSCLKEWVGKLRSNDERRSQCPHCRQGHGFDLDGCPGRASRELDFRSSFWRWIKLYPIFLFTYIYLWSFFIFVLVFVLLDDVSVALRTLFAVTWTLVHNGLTKNKQQQELIKLTNKQTMDHVTGAQLS